MTKIIKAIIKLIKKYLIEMHPSLRLQSLELFKDPSSNKPFLIISPLGKYRPHNVFLEDLINNHKILKKLEFDSLRYVFYAYGVLKASEKNNLFSLVELLPYQIAIKVKNIQTLTIEEWDKNKFNIDFAMLDKSSLKLASSFFSSFNNHNNAHSQEISHHKHLKLVK
jgi:hypothetical protein